MKGKNFNRPGYKPLVLMAPLDWGLGHATRSIPIIKVLLKHGCEVIIAAEGQGRILLEKEFPGIRFLHLQGYHMYYSNKEFLMPLVLLLQLPKIIFRIYKEHSWLKKAVKTYSVNTVISDSRPGLYHSSAHCIYIAHQLKIKTGNRFTEWLVQKLHYRFINRYEECWVPDAPGEINLAGELSHPVRLPTVPVKYIGSLSRFAFYAEEKKYDLLIILSGPEPQRSIFEKTLLKDLVNFRGTVLFVRGLPEGAAALLKPARDVEIIDHLPSAELNLAILRSQIIVSRAGYSTVMDLVKLQKKAILVPTPGQTEQEYLSDYLSMRKLFLCIPQRSFSLTGALQRANAFSFVHAAFPQNSLEREIEDLVQRFG